MSTRDNIRLIARTILLLIKAYLTSVLLYGLKLVLPSKTLINKLEVIYLYAVYKIRKNETNFITPKFYPTCSC